MQFLKHYEIMLNAFKNGMLTEKEWTEYCVCCLDELITTNKNVVQALIRLKENN